MSLRFPAATFIPRRTQCSRPYRGWVDTNRARGEVKQSADDRSSRNLLTSKKNSGAPGEIRTPDLLLRRQSLYPTELRARYPKLYMPQAVASVGASHPRMSACAIGLGGIQR